MNEFSEFKERTLLKWTLSEVLTDSINKRQLLKTLCEKEKLLVTSNFSLSHNVFYSIR